MRELPDRSPEPPCTCAVCSIESDSHGTWFLLVENRWLDRLKILSWHPLLASQAEMRSVCGKLHLKILLAHWLIEGDLQFQAKQDFRVPDMIEITTSNPNPVSLHVGKLMGELAVQRESFSRVWTGSPESLECILNALVGGVDSKRYVSEFPAFEPSTEYALGYSHQ